MANPPHQPGRRAFLQRSVAIVPASTLAAGLAGCSDSEPIVRNPPAAAAAVPVAEYTPRFFNPDEWAFMVAACERLVPEDDEGPGAVTLGVPNFIDIQLDGDYGAGARWYRQGPFRGDAPPEFGHQSRQIPREIYRSGIDAADADCRARLGAAFAALTPDQQDQALARFEAGDADGDVKLSSFFEFMWDNVSQGYLADPIHGGNRDMGSWKMIGFPGARADYVDWAARHNTPYPLGPVDIAGARG